MRVSKEVVTHSFKGKRFEDHGLDLDVLPDLFAYKQLLVATAKELWRRHHPERKNLPKNFENSLCLKFATLEPGSVAVPIYREIETAEQGDFWQADQPDELDQAVVLVSEAIDAADSDQPLPETLPKNIIPLFGEYGRTLREDESFELQPHGSQTKARYTTKSRANLLRLCAPGYTDWIDSTGEVRAVDLNGRFELRLEDGTKVPAKFSPEQEGLVTEALCDHASRRLRVKGCAEFHPGGQLKAIVSVSELAIHPVGQVPFDPSAKPVWEIIEEIGAAVPTEEWDKVPTDGARNLDHYLYGHARRS